MMYTTLPTSMESSTATNPSFPPKLLLLTQVQWISVSALWRFRWCIQYSIQSIHFQFCCWNAPGSKIENGWSGTLVHCSCLTIKDFAVQADMVAGETSIDVGNILWIFYDCPGLMIWEQSNCIVIYGPLLCSNHRAWYYIPTVFATRWGQTW